MNKKNLIWGSLLFVTLTSILVLFVRFQLDNHQRKILKEAEHQTVILSNQMSSQFLRVDELLRYITTLIEIGENQDITQREEYINRELLVHRELSFMSILDGSGQILWNSPMGPSSKEALGDILEQHRMGRQELIFSQKAFQNKGKWVIPMSRALWNQEGQITYLLVAGISQEALFPSPEDPANIRILQISLRDKGLNPLIESTYGGCDEEICSEAEKLILAHKEVEDLWGGAHFYPMESQIVALSLLDSFPYYLSVTLDYQEEKDTFVFQVYLFSILLLLLMSSSWFLSFLRQQSRYNARLDQKNQNLEELNLQLAKTNEERKMLVQEAHHRVKNNLSLINNVISLMVNNGGPYTEKSLFDLEARIIAIQKVHDSLFRSDNLTSIEVSGYINEITGMILSSSSSFPVEVVNKITPFSLPSKKVIPLGILIAELVTNALKYGLEREGTLTFHGSVNPDGMVEISVSNDGKHYREGRSGLGSQLIEALIQQLEGSIRLDKEPQTTFHIIFPHGDD